MPRVLMYHDVVNGSFDDSGFPGGGPARYKMKFADFRRHLDALSAASKAPVILPRARNSDLPSQPSLMMTFDDGGVSARTVIADALEQKGWRGHFFITADYIGRKGFLRSEQIRELDQRGHVIGTHSSSHPERMSSCTRSQLMDEWRRSTEILSNILGKPITAGSVPGGFYSRDVAETASDSGLSDLFTSEPTTHVTIVNGMRVYGRYAIRQSTKASVVVAIASGSPTKMITEATLWKLKKFLKYTGGGVYLQLRRQILNRRHGYS